MSGGGKLQQTSGDTRVVAPSDHVLIGIGPNGNGFRRANDLGLRDLLSVSGTLSSKCKGSRSAVWIEKSCGDKYKEEWHFLT
jgi:hypothetical protein